MFVLIFKYFSFSAFLSLIFLIYGCVDRDQKKVSEIVTVEEIPANNKYGFNLNNYHVVNKKVKTGDTFGSILEENGIDYPEVYNILQKIKNKVNVRRINVGKPYTLLFSKDSVPSPKIFIYSPGIQTYNVIQLRDSIYGKKVDKPVRTVQLKGTGEIESSLYETMSNSGLNEQLTYYISDVYAWNIDFYRLQKGDRFKIIYEEQFVDDTVSIGIKRINAAIFEHSGRDYYAFEFQPDPEKGIVEYFDDSAKNLRRAFLKAPVKFGPVTSRYNLKRRIAYYGNRIRPHKGTDFGANIGTSILATANGVVVKASYTKSNGNYVTIKHNNTYSTQYLHMKRRKAKRGQTVKQGDVIGWVGMTGNTSGPHVCYRFWKNGRQVDPFKQKLPEAKPISNLLKKTYLTGIQEIKIELDCISFVKENSYNNNTLALSTSELK